MSNSYNSSTNTAALDTLRRATGPGYQAAFNGHLLDLACASRRTSTSAVKL